MPSSSADFIHLCLRPYHNLPKHRMDPGYCCVGSTREDCSDVGLGQQKVFLSQWVTISQEELLNTKAMFWAEILQLIRTVSQK